MREHMDGIFKIALRLLCQSRCCVTIHPDKDYFLANKGGLD